MMRNSTEVLIHSYYNTFNRRDVDGFLEALSDDVVHDINQGGREVGKAAFRRFLERMNRCYEEQIVDVQVMTNQDGSRAAAEFTVLGAYVGTDEGLPKARGQRYRLQAGAFFQLKGEKIARISNTYNVKDWLKQVGE
jgi:steroid delta-isomerase-like uncharacterized protein